MVPRYWPPPTHGHLRLRLAAGGADAPGPLLLLLGRLSGRRPLRQAEDQDVVAERETDLEVAAARHRDELLAFELVGHRRRVAAGSCVELPEQLAGLRVVG